MQLPTLEQDTAYADGYKDGFRQGKQSRQGIAEEGISWSALLAVLERQKSKNRNPNNEWYHGWNAAIQCLINDIAARKPTVPK